MPKQQPHNLLAVLVGTASERPARFVVCYCGSDAEGVFEFDVVIINCVPAFLPFLGGEVTSTTRGFRHERDVSVFV